MESLFQKIALGKRDEDVHREFVKFSKGTFERRFLIGGKKKKHEWIVKTGPEFANYLIRACLENSTMPLEMQGVIVSTFDMRKDISFPIEHVKQFMGIKQLVLNTRIEPKVLLSLMEKYPKAFYALSFSTSDMDLKIKPKIPKSAKPAASKEKEQSANFCTLKTSDAKIIHALFFDFPEFNEIKISHTIQITEITLPKDEQDPVKIRENAKRKGVIIRNIILDGKVIKREIPFEA